MKSDNYSNDNKKYQNYNQNKINNYRNYDSTNKMNIPNSDIYSFNYYMNNNQRMLYLPMAANPYYFPFITPNYGLNNINNIYFNPNNIDTNKNLINNNNQNINMGQKYMVNNPNISIEKYQESTSNSHLSTTSDGDQTISKLNSSNRSEKLNILDSVKKGLKILYDKINSGDYDTNNISLACYYFCNIEVKPEEQYILDNKMRRLVDYMNEKTKNKDDGDLESEIV